MKNPFIMSKRERILQLAESFVDSIKKKYNILKEEEEQEIEFPINPEANVGRMQIINILKDPKAFGMEETPSADEAKARAAATAILEKGEYAQLNGKPINFSTIIGRKSDTLGDMSVTTDTQTMDLIIEMLAFVYNTPTGQPDALGLVDAVNEQHKSNIVSGIASIFDVLDTKGNPTVFLDMVTRADASFHSTPPPVLPKMQTASGKAIVDIDKVKEGVAMVRSKIFEKIKSKILIKKVNPEGFSSTNKSIHSLQKIAAYMTTIYRRELSKVFQKMAKQERQHYSIDTYNQSNEQGAGDNKVLAKAMHDFREKSIINKNLGDVGRRYWQDVADEIKNPHPKSFYKDMGVLQDGQNLHNLKPHMKDFFQIVVDNMKKEVKVDVGTEENPKFIDKQEFESLDSLLQALKENPPYETYPAAAQELEKTSNIKSLSSAVGNMFTSDAVLRAMQLVYLLKYKDKLGSEKDFDGKRIKVGDIMRIHHPDHVDPKNQPKFYDPSKGEEPVYKNDDEMYSPDIKDYDAYWASQFNENEEFMNQLHEAVTFQLFRRAMLQEIKFLPKNLL